MTQPIKQPRSGHTLRVAAVEDTIVLRVECHEPVGAFCRTSPGGVPGSCYAVDWFDLSPIAELHDPDADTESLYDGMPVTVSWSGEVESWVWRGVPDGAGC